MTEIQPPTVFDHSDPFLKVSQACAALDLEGVPLGPRPVQRWMKEHLGSGVRWESTASLINRWEAENKKPGRAARGTSRQTVEVTPPLEATLERHPELASPLDLIAAELAKCLQHRAQLTEEAFQAAIILAREEERAAAHQAIAHLEQAHAADLAERDRVITAMRIAEAEMGAELDRSAEALEASQASERNLQTKGADLETALERALQEKNEAVERINATTLRAREEITRLNSELSKATTEAVAAKEARAVMAEQVVSLRQDLAAERNRIERLQGRHTSVDEARKGGNGNRRDGAAAHRGT